MVKANEYINLAKTKGNSTGFLEEQKYLIVIVWLGVLYV